MGMERIVRAGLNGTRQNVHQRTQGARVVHGWITVGFSLSVERALPDRGVVRTHQDSREGCR